jgi:hypothetical protein
VERIEQIEAAREAETKKTLEVDIPFIERNQARAAEACANDAS